MNQVDGSRFLSACPAANSAATAIPTGQAQFSLIAQCLRGKLGQDLKITQPWKLQDLLTEQENLTPEDGRLKHAAAEYNFCVFLSTVISSFEKSRHNRRKEKRRG